MIRAIDAKFPNRPVFYGTLLFFTVFLLSGLLFLLFSNTHADRVLFFPDFHADDGSPGHLLSGEVRRLPRRDDLEGNIELLVKEIVLGPLELGHERIYPRKTRVRSVLLRNGTLYLDFSVDILFSESRNPLLLEQIIGYTEKNILFNFPRVRRIVVAVDGEVPDLSALSGEL